MPCCYIQQDMAVLSHQGLCHLNTACSSLSLYFYVFRCDYLLFLSSNLRDTTYRHADWHFGVTLSTQHILKKGESQKERIIEIVPTVLIAAQSYESTACTRAGREPRTRLPLGLYRASIFVAGLIPLSFSCYVELN